MLIPSNDILFYHLDLRMKRVEVEICTHVTKSIFINDIYPLRMPVILRGLNIGPCCEKWTVGYMAEAIKGAEVKVHVSSEKQMDFITKNFIYRSLTFPVLIKRATEEVHKEYFIDETEVYYLRALGHNVRKDVADITQQFPQLADDITIPDVFEREDFFSSVFRIASKGVQLWTHYDVMDNLLIQVCGHKRILLFRPQDANKLYLEGDKSKVIDVDAPDLNKYPLFAEALRYEAILQPGDVLFIPALWFHNVRSEEFSVAVNVFWKNLSHEVYDVKDTYGNRDLLPAQRAMQIVDGATKLLEQLPADYRDFYARKLVIKIESKLYNEENNA